MIKTFNKRNYESTGCISVDMVLNCIAFYRERNRPLKTVYLNDAHYYSFDSFAKKNNWVSEELKDNYELDYVIDGVTIQKSSLISKSLEVDFYPEDLPRFSEHSRRKD